MKGMEKLIIICYISTAAGVRCEFLLSFVDVSRPTVHCKVLLLSSPKAWHVRKSLADL